jgi:hypothetical protein
MSASFTGRSGAGAQQAGRGKPCEPAGPPGLLEVDPADAALLELERPRRSCEVRRNHAEVGLVPHAGHPRAARACEHRLERPGRRTGRERIEDVDLR